MGGFDRQAGLSNRGARGEGLRGAKSPGEYRPWAFGKPEVGANGLAGGRKLRSGRRLWPKLVTVHMPQGDQERRAACQTTEKGTFSRSGNQAIACERGRRGNDR